MRSIFVALCALACVTALVAVARAPAGAARGGRAPGWLAPYRREDWGGWLDVDGDCQDTRAEVLQAESLGPVVFADARRCRVLSGLWRCPYTGRVFTEAAELDIDHLVPLEEAHRSGGVEWSRGRRRRFANDLEDVDQLVAVSARANRSKGAQTPASWLPPHRASWCWYSRAWRRIKARWGLRVGTERQQLAVLELACGREVMTR